MSKLALGNSSVSNINEGVDEGVNEKFMGNAEVVRKTSESFLKRAIKLLINDGNKDPEIIELLERDEQLQKALVSMVNSCVSLYHGISASVWGGTDDEKNALLHKYRISNSLNDLIRLTDRCFYCIDPYSKFKKMNPHLVLPKNIIELKVTALKEAGDIAVNLYEKLTELLQPMDLVSYEKTLQEIAPLIAGIKAKVNFRSS